MTNSAIFLLFRNTSTALLFTAIVFSFAGCGGGGNSDDNSNNNAPTSISLSSNSVNENDPGSIVGTLSATDADPDETFTFSTSHQSFEVDGNNLKLKSQSTFDFEKTTSVTVAVTVTNSKNLSLEENLLINIADVLDTYHFTDGNQQSTVSYSGQTARMVLINELNQYINSELQAELNDQTLTTRQQVLDKLNSFYQISAQQYEETADNFIIDFIDSPEQTTLREISSSQKDLFGKIAGSDEVGQHKDWNNGDFEGWGAKGSTTPHDLLQIYFGLLADHAEEFINGSQRTEFNQPGGTVITSIYITEDGRDLKQLIQKFLLGAVAFSQATDDYLDNDTADKGLLSSNIPEANGDVYSALEHVWDEGFGYFGAARDYLAYSDEEIAGAGGRDDYANSRHDSNDDGFFDLYAEVNLGNSVNAGKRDRGSVSGTDFSTAAFQGFLQGRKIINDNLGNPLTQQQMDDLVVQRDQILDAWEKAISATIIHYINDTHADLERLRTDDNDFSYPDLAKHWSEMKGFALNLQFNPHSPVSDANYTLLHNLMGDAPVLTIDDIADYQADLIQARDLLQQAYNFADEDAENW